MIQIDIDHRNRANFPNHLRKPIVLAWLQLLSTPIKRILDTFYHFSDKHQELAAINGQVIYLEYILNTYFNSSVFVPDHLSPTDFNPNGDLIYISDHSIFDNFVVLFILDDDNEKTTFYTESEGNGVVFHHQSEVYDLPHFIINIPSSVSYNQYQLEALVNKYKLAGKKYIINIV